MLTATNLIVFAAMLVGTVGIVLPILPGLFIVWGSTLVWALERADRAGWIVFGVATAAYAVGLVSQYLIPGKRMRSAGVATSTLVLALVVGVIGLFVIPIIGAPIGFVGAIYVVERIKNRDGARAWSATKTALRAVALSMGIELLAAMTIIATWAIGVWVTRPVA